MYQKYPINLNIGRKIDIIIRFFNNPFNMKYTHNQSRPRRARLVFHGPESRNSPKTTPDSIHSDVSAELASLQEDVSQENEAADTEPSLLSLAASYVVRGPVLGAAYLNQQMRGDETTAEEKPVGEQPSGRSQVLRSVVGGPIFGAVGAVEEQRSDDEAEPGRKGEGPSLAAQAMRSAAGGPFFGAFSAMGENRSDDEVKKD